MSAIDDGRLPDGTGLSSLRDGAADASPPKASIPSAAFTPPPWRHYDDSDSANHRHSIVAWGKTIAHIYCTKGYEIEDAANARLIAHVHELGQLLLMYADLTCDFGAVAGCGGVGTPPCRGCTIRNTLTSAGLL